MAKTSPPNTARFACVVDSATADEVNDVVTKLSVNRSALLRRGIRLALDELKAKHKATPARKG